ncbi:MAG TPA: histidine kinase [Agriterribacter sp.]|nr:histidine kinase [Agriterribacter sp.]HRQ51360.1 histidine kinase [Agriterribacter sp.]
MLSKISRYWCCQICGWGAFVLINIFFAYTYDKTISGKLIIRLLIALSAGIPITHMMRNIIIRRNWLILPIEKIIPRLFICIVIASFVYSLSLLTFFELFNLSETDPEKKVGFINNLILRTLDGSPILMIWVLIYYVYHFFQKNKKQEVDTFRLQSLVKELELKTIKSHINPHFIFNALNSIRALVDENPQRARRAITELSNILRSSMQTEKMETVPLEQELNIVKDYLALEQMRFEERLNVQFTINENTLCQPIPPMMLQTLAENAIKHGISRQVNGGRITIISDFVDDHHEIIIRNSGFLNGHAAHMGFGLQSTQDRLNLLFGTKATFEIRDIPGNMVEAKVVMPAGNPVK